jgi:VIT1/CCC1 family predicted Fe2+/Mn2+ transporter
MPLPSPRKKQALLALSPVLAVFLVCDLLFDGNCLNAFTIKLAFVLGAIAVAVSELRRMKAERTASGLSDDEYLLKQAGGRLQLKSQASTVKAIGWFFIALSIVPTLALLLITRSVSYAVVPLVLIGALCFALGVNCLRHAERSLRAAARSAVKSEQ